MIDGPMPELDERGLPAGYPFKAEHEVTPREAQALVGAGRAVLLDCRTQREWEGARIEGAALVPLAEIESRLDEVRELMEDGRELIVHCHHGVRSLRATLMLRALAVSPVRSMAGGIDLWSLTVDPSVPRYASGGATPTGPGGRSGR